MNSRPPRKMLTELSEIPQSARRLSRQVQLFFGDQPPKPKLFQFYDDETPFRFLDLPPELKHAIIAELKLEDKSSLSQTSKELHNLVTPIIYAEVKLCLKASANKPDPFISALQALSYARLEVLQCVRHFEIDGFWYDFYHEIESQLGEKAIVSPTVRMLNIIVAHIIDRMSNLESFKWDLQVAPIDVLIEAIARSQRLSQLSLRLSTSSPSSPYFFPNVILTKFSPLKSLSLEAINSQELLSEISKIIQMSPQLEVLRITCAYNLEGMPLADVFSKIKRDKPLHVRVLDLRCFDDLRVEKIWTALDPLSLRQLTMRCSPSTAEKNEGDVAQFWLNMKKAKVRLRSVYTDMVEIRILDYLMSCDQLEDLFLIPRHDTIWGRRELTNDILSKVAPKFQHSLKRIGFYSRDDGDQPELFNVDPEELMSVAKSCKHLVELGFQTLSAQLNEALKAIPYLTNLVAIHIVYSDGASKNERAREEVIEKFMDILEKNPDLPLRFVAINFEAIYELERKGEQAANLRVEAKKKSPKDWVDDPYIVLFSQNLWEW